MLCRICFCKKRNRILIQVTTVCSYFYKPALNDLLPVTFSIRTSGSFLIYNQFFKFKKMKKIYIFLCLAFLCQWGFSQVVLTAENGSYLQNFDGMGATTNYSTGWTGIKYDGSSTTIANGAFLGPVVGNGSSPNGGNIYNVGTTSAADRALGSIASGTIIGAYGTSFQNNTTKIMLDVNFSGVMEQWRTGNDPAVERVYFEYSTDATSLSTGSWTSLSSMDLVEKLTSTTGNTGVDGNSPANQTAISGSIGSLNLLPGSTLWIRWRDVNDAGTDGLYAVDNFQLTYTSGAADVTRPTISATNPTNGSTSASGNQLFSITFSEAVQKGTGNIYLKKTSDNSIVQTLDVTNTDVSLSGNTASFSLGALDLLTGYYIQMDSSTFRDPSGNSFVGIYDAATWSFTVGTTFAAFDFNNCGAFANVNRGFSQYSVVGDSLWKCTQFGNNNTNGVQMNGYVNANTGNDANEDWLISPSFNLAGYNIPLLNFYSVSAYVGPSLRLMVSTDYVAGAPSTATWTEVFGKFPAINSFAWTLSDSINLSNFKQPNVHVAWVYYSTIDEASRWTLDDVAFFNSNVIPSPFVVPVSTNLNVGYAPYGGNGAWQPVTFNANSLTGNLSFTASANFQLSKDTTADAGSSVTFSPTEANVDAVKTFYVRLVPDSVDKGYTGTITATYSGNTYAFMSLLGTSLSPAKTLDIVNWNLEWFGSPYPTLGPTNKDQQFSNVLKVLRSIDADIFSLVEVVDTSRFRRLTDSLGTGYGSIVCNYGTRAVNPTNGAYNTNIATAQKEGFIYKRSVFSNVTARPFLLTNYNDTLNPSSYYWWSSGRFPYIMEADVTLENQTKHMVFVLLHAKANTGTDAEKRESYFRRKNGILNMKDSLDANFSTANIIILGDYNDRLSGTIAHTTGADTVSSYKTFVVDSTDNNSYKSLTLPFVNVGTTAAGNSAIDNVIVSNELAPYYLANSLQIRKDVASLVSSYASTTTDHYPIFSRFYFNQVIVLPVTILNFTGTKNGETSLLQWQVAKEVNLEKYIIQASADGRSFTAIGTVMATGKTTYQFNDNKPFAGNNFYRLQSVDKDGKVAYSAIVKLYFGKAWQVMLSPNPVKETLYVQSTQGGKLTISLYDATGRKVKQFTTIEVSAGETKPLSINHLPSGVYSVQIISGTERTTSKIMVE